MGRSVSYATGSVWIKYIHFEYHEEEDEDGNLVEPDDFLRQYQWDDFIDDLRNVLRERYKSLEDADAWIGREDRVILENCRGRVGVSEYCGLVSLWCVPRDGYDANEDALNAHWCSMIGDNVGKLLDKRGFTRLRKLGTFSNGEGVYERIAA